MKYKVGDVVKCYVDTRKSGVKSIVSKGEIDKSTMEIDLFQVIYVDKEANSYSILLPNSILGWVVSDWHIMYQDIAKAFKGQNFWEITEGYIFGKN